MNVQQVLFLIGIICWGLLLLVLFASTSFGITNTSVIYDIFVGVLALFGLIFIVGGIFLSRLRHGFRRL